MRGPARYITEKFALEDKLRNSNDWYAVDCVRSYTGLTSMLGAVGGVGVALAAVQEAIPDHVQIAYTIGEVSQPGMNVVGAGGLALVAAGVFSATAESFRFHKIATEVIVELPEPIEGPVEDY